MEGGDDEREEVGRGTKGEEKGAGGRRGGVKRWGWSLMSVEVFKR